MRTRTPALIVSSLLTATAFAAAPAASAVQPSDAELALRWAPVHYQDTDSSDYDADYLTAVNYDGDWDTLNNWEHQDDDPNRLTGDVSYSVVETQTHWFLVYGFYHPRDWVDFPDWFDLFTHENDMEGALLAVRKDGSPFGTLEGMVTVAHSDFYSYVPEGSPFTDGGENIDGTLLMQDHGGVARPMTFQEAKGHGVYAHDGNGFPGGDGVVYYPGGGAGEVPSGGNDRSVTYRLTDLLAPGELWSRRDNAETFVGWGTFRGDNGKDNAANAPWGWNDGDDGDVDRGMIATDPAHLVDVYFDGTGEFSLDYLRNPYQG